MLDIAPGDVLVIGSNEYPIRSITRWDGWGSTQTFALDAIVAASTKRPPGVDVNGQRGVPVAHIASFRVTRFDVIAPDIAYDAPLRLPYRLLRCFAADATSFVELVVEERLR